MKVYIKTKAHSAIYIQSSFKQKKAHMRLRSSYTDVVFIGIPNTAMSASLYRLYTDIILSSRLFAFSKSLYVWIDWIEKKRYKSNIKLYGAVAQWYSQRSTVLRVLGFNPPSWQSRVALTENSWPYLVLTVTWTGSLIRWLMSDVSLWTPENNRRTIQKKILGEWAIHNKHPILLYKTDFNL